MEEAEASAVEETNEDVVEVTGESSSVEVTQEASSVEVTQESSSVEVTQESSSVEVTQETSVEVTEQTSQESTSSESVHMETTQQSSVHIENDSDMADLTSPAEAQPPQEVQAVEEPAPVEEVSPDAVEAGPVVAEEPAPQEVAPAVAASPAQQIQVKNQTIDDLENKQPVSYDQSVKESDWHTWRPRGKYDLPKMEITFGDLRSESLPDIPLTEIPIPQPAAAPKEPLDAQPVEMIDQYAPQPPMVNGDLNSPGVDIPFGIPLLARVLPKEEGDNHRESIPLERLFTPATDSGDITPRKKKVFSSSAFYAPNHPTVEDQVNLAQMISTSLIDENNSASRGQNMYIKRKKRSVKWIHQAPGDDEEAMLAPPRGQKERPGLTLQTKVTSSEQAHIQQQLHHITVGGQPLQSPEVNQTTLESPTGKGAELFAKRKKRMDQFIVDETSVQKSSMFQQQQQSSVLSQSSSSSSSSFKQTSMSASSSHTSSQQQSQSSSMSGAQFLRSTCTAVQPTVDSTVQGTAGEGAPVYTAEVKVVQRASLPPTPSYEVSEEDLPHHSILLEQFDAASKEDKRKSFNFAAKGWGTYNNFYSPITFTTAT